MAVEVVVRRNGLICLDFDGERLLMHREDIPDIVRALLKEMNPVELKDCEPLVLYFGNDEDRDEMIAACTQSFKSLRSIKL